MDSAGRTRVFWNSEDIVQLIQEFKARPQLWCPTHENYSLYDGIRRKEDFDDICNALNVFTNGQRYSKKQVKDKINKLRQEYQQQRMRSISKPEWDEYYKLLSFLDCNQESAGNNQSDENNSNSSQDKTYPAQSNGEKREHLPAFNVDPTFWTVQNTLTLIKEYGKRPVLWCPKHPDYNLYDGLRRKKEFDEICDAINELRPEFSFFKLVYFSEVQVKDKLRNIRYEHQKRHVKKPRKPEWVEYFRQMSYLDEFTTQTRPTSVNPITGEICTTSQQQPTTQNFYQSNQPSASGTAECFPTGFYYPDESLDLESKYSADPNYISLSPPLAKMPRVMAEGDVSGPNLNSQISDNLAQFFGAAISESETNSNASPATKEHAPSGSSNLGSNNVDSSEQAIDRDIKRFDTIPGSYVMSSLKRISIEDPAQLPEATKKIRDVLFNLEFQRFS